MGVTHADAAAVLARFIVERLPWFGDYEDAMAVDHDTLFHSTLSPYLNIGLLTPRQVLDAAVAAYDAGMAPLAAVEDLCARFSVGANTCTSSIGATCRPCNRPMAGTPPVPCLTGLAWAEWDAVPRYGDCSCMAAWIHAPYRTSDAFV